jgi:hypothetical protein
MTSRQPSLRASAWKAGGFVRDDTPTAEVERREAVIESLAGTVRDLIDATIRTTVDDDEVHRVRDDLAALVDRLRAARSRRSQVQHRIPVLELGQRRGGCGERDRPAAPYRP